MSRFKDHLPGTFIYSEGDVLVFVHYHSRFISRTCLYTVTQWPKLEANYNYLVDISVTPVVYSNYIVYRKDIEFMEVYPTAISNHTRTNGMSILALQPTIKIDDDPRVAAMKFQSANIWHHKIHSRWPNTTAPVPVPHQLQPILYAAIRTKVQMKQKQFHFIYFGKYNPKSKSHCLIRQLTFNNNSEKWWKKMNWNLLLLYFSCFH